MGEGVATGDTPEPGELPAGHEESSCSRFCGLGERSPMSQGVEPPAQHWLLRILGMRAQLPGLQ